MHDLYRSRSEAVAGVALAMVNAGWGWPEYAAAMTDPTNALAGWFVNRADGRRRGDTVDRLRKTWDNAVLRSLEFPSTCDPAAALQEVGHIIAAAHAYDWQGKPGKNGRRDQSGKRDRAVFLALCELATEYVTLTPSVSVRTLCERTSYRSAGTVVAALKSLTVRGLVSVSKAATPDTPNAYRIRAPKGAQLVNTITYRDGVRDHVHNLRTPEVAMVSGEYAAAVYAAVDDIEALSAREIARRASVSSRTADKWLRALHRDGLVAHPHGEDTWIRTMHDPAIALGAEAFEAGRERATRHELQREGFRAARQSGYVPAPRAEADRPAQSRGRGARR